MNLESITCLFGLIWFYGISTIVGHLMLNSFYTYIKYKIFTHILKIPLLNKPELVLFPTVKWFRLNFK